MKTVLITGANGALGKVIVNRLCEDKQWRVITAIRQCGDNNSLQIDTRNREQIFTVVKNTAPDLVLHLAATFVNDFDEAYVINVDAARHILNAVKQYKFRTKILLIGSAAEYGAVKPEENPIREDHVLNPVSIYGLTKAWQTQLASFYSSYGMDVVVARVFNLDGPGLSEHLFVGRLQQQINEVLLKRKSVIELGSLSGIRDYIYLNEATDQILAIARYGESGRVYHVASGKPVEMREILMRYLTAHKLDKLIVRESANLSNRVGYDVPAIYADITRTLQLMNTRG